MQDGWLVQEAEAGEVLHLVQQVRICRDNIPRGHLHSLVQEKVLMR